MRYAYCALRPCHRYVGGSGLGPEAEWFDGSMRVLSRQEAVAWCQGHYVALNNLALPERSDADLKFKIPGDAQKRVNLVNRAMEAFADEPSHLV